MAARDRLAFDKCHRMSYRDRHCGVAPGIESCRARRRKDGSGSATACAAAVRPGRGRGAIRWGSCATGCGGTATSSASRSVRWCSISLRPRPREARAARPREELPPELALRPHPGRGGCGVGDDRGTGLAAAAADGAAVIPRAAGRGPGGCDDGGDRRDALRWQAYARSGEPLDVAAEFVALTLRIVGRALLGIDLGGEADQIGPAMTTALGYLEHRLANLLSLPLSVPTPRNLRAGVRWQPSTPSSSRSSPAAAAHPKRIARPVTCSRCCWPPGTRRAGRGLTDRELRDQVLTFIGAGHETTAVALAWTLYLLSQHPEAAPVSAPRSPRSSATARPLPATCRGWHIPAG